MNQILNQIRHRLFSGRRYDHGMRGVTVTETPYQSSCWRLSRAFSAFHLVDLIHVDADKRLDALENKLAVLSPYCDPGYWAAWEDGLAQVWVWDKSLVDRSLAENLQQGDQVEFVEVLPESVFGPRLDQGLQLFEGLDGYILQYWRSGVLAAERFWSQRPGPEEIAQFARGVGVAAIESEVEPESTGDVPWRRTQGLTRNFRRIEGQLVTATALLLLFLITLEAFTWIALQTRMVWQTSEINALEQQAEPVLGLREKVLEARDRNHALMSLGPMSQLELMAKVSEKLPASSNDQGRLQQWTYEAGELSFTIYEPTANLEEYAVALDRVAGLGNIELVPNDRTNNLLVKARIIQ